MKLPLKFNSGQGALVCACHGIIATGFEHSFKIYTCKHCKRKWTVHEQTEGGYIAFTID